MKQRNIGEFATIFGPTPRIVILEFFLEGMKLDYTIGDVAEEKGMNRATTYNAGLELIKEGYLIPTRKISGAQLYTLNVEKEEVKILIKVFNLLLKNIVEEYTKKKIKEKVYV